LSSCCPERIEVGWGDEGFIFVTGAEIIRFCCPGFKGFRGCFPKVVKVLRAICPTGQLRGFDDGPVTCASAEIASERVVYGAQVCREIA